MDVMDSHDYNGSREPRVHLHTTVSASTKNLLKELSSDSRRINDVLEEAVKHYSTRRDLPNCEECDAIKTSRLHNSLIQSADMILVSSNLLSLCAGCGLGTHSVRDLTLEAKKIGIEQTKLLMSVGVIPEEFWENNYESLVANANFLRDVGVLRSVECSSERKRLLLTTGMFQGLPELLVIMLIAGWEEAGFTFDVEIVADNKISVTWIHQNEYNQVKIERDRRVITLWRDRRERLSSQTGHRGVVTLSPSLLDWLVTNTIEDPISDKTLVSIREHAQQLDVINGEKDTSSVSNLVDRTVSVIGTLGLWEWSNVSADGDMMRVQIRSRTAPMKDLSMKLLRSLLALEKIEEISREEGVASAVLHFTKAREVGRKYPSK
ncbi:MAG: hypothetical protein JSW61_07860 [Candidatus Thorarchaeota archaeon]|nr:MAG: hypothetical protein JSW61_07860 [Candidatus Thorarchaeota archaeon]